MSDGDLFCNFKKCKKLLNESAFVTRCSHVFCEEDGIREIQNSNAEKKCPACQTPLVQSYDLIKVDLNPTEEFKSMVLAGMRPEFVMDVATRAIMFWTYQLHQEHLHQKIVSKTLKEALSQMKNETDTECLQFKAEIQCLKRKINGLEKELQKQTQKSTELSEKVAEKAREVQKWQMTYESVRRKQLSEYVLQQGDKPGVSFENRPMARNVGPLTMDEIFGNRNKLKPGITPNYDQVRGRQDEHFPIRKESSPKKAERRHDPSAFNFQPQHVNYVSPKIDFDCL